MIPIYVNQRPESDWVSFVTLPSRDPAGRAEVLAQLEAAFPEPLPANPYKYHWTGPLLDLPRAQLTADLVYDVDLDHITREGLRYFFPGVLRLMALGVLPQARISNLSGTNEVASAGTLSYQQYPEHQQDALEAVVRWCLPFDEASWHVWVQMQQVWRGWSEDTACLWLRLADHHARSIHDAGPLREVLVAESDRLTRLPIPLPPAGIYPPAIAGDLPRSEFRLKGWPAHQAALDAAFGQAPPDSWQDALAAYHAAGTPALLAVALSALLSHLCRDRISHTFRSMAVLSWEDKPGWFSAENLPRAELSPPQQQAMLDAARWYQPWEGWIGLRLSMLQAFRSWTPEACAEAFAEAVRACEADPGLATNADRLRELFEQIERRHEP